MTRLIRRKMAPITYQSGGEGFIKWCEENVKIKIYIDGLAVWCQMDRLPTQINPETGRYSRLMWEEQKKIALKALKMQDGRFLYRLIVLCWMRGEGKSLFVCLIQLWKFYNFPSQQIMLGANSKDQVKFVHFDIMRDIILNSPNLLAIVGKRNVQEKEIRMKNARNEIVSIVRSISSFSGIVSNITGYTFSEIFDMKNPKFFTQLDGSIRNIPNALGVIDSTVSAKDHILYKLYDAFRKGLDTTLYFSHRCTEKGSYKDYWNPEMTQKQLNSYKTKFPDREFAMYFKNTWDAGSKKMFPQDVVMASHYIGYRNSLGQQSAIISTCNKYLEAKLIKEKEAERTGNLIQPTHIPADLIPITDIYNLSTGFHQPRAATFEELESLSEAYNTDFAILAGVDRADPMKMELSEGARSMVSFIAKGLPGSKTDPAIYLQKDTTVLNYMYFLLHLQHVPLSDLETIKLIIEQGIDRYDGVDTLCTERWGMWDVGDWCEENEISFTPISASYNVQKEGFSEFFNLYMKGQFKTPSTVIKGSKDDDILEEEILLFDHDPVRKFYGSPEKREKFGIQDDCIFSVNWGIYGGRFIGVEDFRTRHVAASLGEWYPDKSKLIGSY